VVGKNSGISWTDHTFNPWWGCTRIEGSPACGPAEGEPGDRCYAEAWAERVGYSESGSQFPIWGAHEQRRFFGDKHWTEPLYWNNAARAEGVRKRVFCMSMGDWAEGRPDQEKHLLRLWGLIRATPHLDWLMLTKRPQLIPKLCPGDIRRLPRVWQGTTAETERWLYIRWDHLKRAEAEIYWLSVEPMFERMTLPQDFLALGARGWVICGGQSGAHARPLDPAWARYLRDQCLDAGVRFHMKQMSGRTKDQLQAIPEDLLIRQYPQPMAMEGR
jgi:protein gp37